MFKIIFTVHQKRFHRISGSIKLKIATGKKTPYLDNDVIIRCPITPS